MSLVQHRVHKENSVLQKNQLVLKVITRKSITTMEQQIINSLKHNLAGILPEIKNHIRSLKDFTIFSGAALKAGAPENIKHLVDPRSWCVTMKFDSTGTREDAKKAFQFAMVDKLGLPSTSDIDDEIIPKQDYSPSRQLAGPSDTSSDVIDIDDAGNVKNTVGSKQDLSVSPTSKYFAVEFKIFGVPRARSRSLPRQQTRQFAGHATRQIGR